ncbi:MAG: FAD-dependent oxidoreductase [Armatimonas sp.]
MNLKKIIVVGGGPAGIAAALSAARAGGDVTLIERLGFCGGSATAMQVPAFGPFSDRTRSIVGGIAWEVLMAHQKALGRPLADPESYYTPQDQGRMDWVPIDVELLKRLYDELLETAGVTVLFHTFVPEVQKEGNRVTSITLANKSGLTTLNGAVFIDATGDADLAARAGCPFELGDESGLTQGMTLCFTITGGSRTQYLNYVYSTGDGYLKNLVAKAKADGAWDLPDASLVGMSFKDEITAGCNLGHVWGFDATDATSVSHAEREGRQVAAKLVNFLRAYVPGQESITLVSTGPHIGVRESRRIIGDYTLTLDDYLACHSFPDEIARCAYFIDLHAATTEEAARAKAVTDGGKTSASLPPGQSHGIPYRCLIPQGVENLLVAGRSLSAERAVQGAARIMPYCFAMGEAAGLAAVLVLEAGGAVRGIDTSELRERLRGVGAYLPTSPPNPLP